MNKKLLTIVIAAYNKENCLRRCLNSIIDKRAMPDVEVLVVNDGSRDKTYEIAKEYENKYHGYIYAIDKENGNYGSVMNVGLKLAQGKYFRTLDADDWYDTGAFVKFVEDLKTSDADLVICDGVIHYEPDGHEERMRIDNEFEKNTDLTVTPQMWQNKSIKAWTKVQTMVFKTHIIRESGLKWLENIFYTDTQYCYWPLRLVKTVRFASYPVYVYLVGIDEQSMSPQNVKKNYTHFVAVAESMIENFKINHEPNNPMRLLQEKFICQIMGYVYSVLLEDEKTHLSEIIKLHKKARLIPGLCVALEKQCSKCGISYIKGLEAGKLSTINISLYKCFMQTKKFLKSLLQR